MRARQGHRRLIEKQKDILELEVRDTGNTIGKMRHDLGAAVAQLDYYAGLDALLVAKVLLLCAVFHVHLSSLLSTY